MESVHRAHGLNPSNQQPHWITAVAAYVNTDLIASGMIDVIVLFSMRSFMFVVWMAQDRTMVSFACGRLRSSVSLRKL